MTKNQTGFVLFLEEDDYLANDALHMLKLMQQQAAASCPKCNVLSLGFDKEKTIDDYHSFQHNHVILFHQIILFQRQGLENKISIFCYCVSGYYCTIFQSWIFI